MRSNEFLKAAKVSQYISNSASFNSSTEFKKACLNKNSTYEEIYLLGLKQVEYNILLEDYAYLQFSRDKNGELRFAYYPNPFIGAATEKVAEVTEMREYLEEGLIDMEEYLHAISEIRNTIHPPLFRYEHAPTQYVELIHPCSHFHLGHHSENRWPVKRVLTPEAFSLMVLKYFYKLSWEQADLIQSGKNKLALDDVYLKEKVKCKLLPVSLFSQKEARQFFWG